MSTIDIRAGAHTVARSAAAEEFRRLVEPHWHDLVRFARRMAPPGQADDVLQDALTNAWRKRDQFDPDRGEAKTWLLAIVANQSRKGHGRTRWHLELVDAAVESDDTEADVDLHRALGALTTRPAMPELLDDPIERRLHADAGRGNADVPDLDDMVSRAIATPGRSTKPAAAALTAAAAVVIASVGIELAQSGGHARDQHPAEGKSRPAVVVPENMRVTPEYLPPGYVPSDRRPGGIPWIETGPKRTGSIVVQTGWSAIGNRVLLEVERSRGAPQTLLVLPGKPRASRISGIVDGHPARLTERTDTIGATSARCLSWNVGKIRTRVCSSYGLDGGTVPNGRRLLKVSDLRKIGNSLP